MHKGHLNISKLQLRGTLSWWHYVLCDMGTSDPDHPPPKILGLAMNYRGDSGCFGPTTVISNRDTMVDILVLGNPSPFSWELGTLIGSWWNFGVLLFLPDFGDRGSILLFISLLTHRWMDSLNNHTRPQHSIALSGVFFSLSFLRVLTCLVVKGYYSQSRSLSFFCSHNLSDKLKRNLSPFS